MVAVIDGQVGCGIEIRPAASARLLRGLIEAHLEIRIRQPDGGRQARNSRANDVGNFLHEMMV
jgi:hypothetical protein